ncbi:MAG: DUF4912 domain-containing protein [Endomicrobiia bacterium]|nr:DUF4912 domain-containing protein [Endomicrobiaceae bacterium]MDD3053723.1 DUF4912 domain-containing protein [Endomicrobiaceae bacterium]MDD3922752.1 DUF4912 domain-containing protein [Endomicrobiaceae bacterium]MDD5102052.1 DUF4912 domain-containing protein [Endomicrobiaceae bacterium]
MVENLSSKLESKQEKTVNKAGLPLDYGDTKITVLPRDPICLFAYWSISKQISEKIENQFGKNVFNGSKLIIRVYDTTDISFDGNNANRYFDIFVTPDSDSWYINVGEFNRCWCVDIGYLTNDGKFIPVARSNKVDMPRYGVSNVTDEQWAMLQVEFEKLLKISGVNQIGMSSFDIAKLMRERWEEIVSISLPSSHTMTSSFKTHPKHQERIYSHNKDSFKSFWLKADTEIIVYGATEPDAQLTLDGQKVKLSADGSFSLRFYLPNGDQNYSIEATSNDGTMKKSITFEIKKNTK